MSAIAIHFSVARLKTIGFWALKFVLAAFFFVCRRRQACRSAAMVEVFERVGSANGSIISPVFLRWDGAALLLWVPTTALF
jgi:hypothetical protein